MADWKNYFHYPTGTAFEIDGPGGYNGTGKVVDNSPNRLALRLDLPAWGPAPALQGVVTVEYSGEGPGNRVLLAEDGKPAKEDRNATVRSDDPRKQRSVASGPVNFSVRSEGPKEIDLDVRMGGKDYDFDLKV